MAGYTPIATDLFIWNIGEFKTGFTPLETGNGWYSPRDVIDGYDASKWESASYPVTNFVSLSTTLSTKTAKLRNGGKIEFPSPSNWNFWKPNAKKPFNTASAFINILRYYLYPYPLTDNSKLYKVIIYGSDSNNCSVQVYMNATDLSEFLHGAYGPNFGDDSETGGGEGDFNINTDSIDFPGLPDTGALDTGLIKMYNPTSTELTKMSKFLWSNDLATNLIKVLNDPMEALISLNMFPIAPEVTATKNNIIFGNLKAFEEIAPETYSEISSYQLTSQYKTFDCGTINIAEHFGSALDYAPYTKLEIFIPFSGMHEINIDDVMDGSIQLKYNIDFLTGAFVATVKCTKSNKYNLDAVIYHWSGVMAVPLPVTATSYTQKIASTIQALTTVTTALSTGNPAAIASGVAGGVMNMMNAKPHIQKSGNTGMIAGAMDNLTPYLILTRPVQSKPEDYQNYKGWTSNITTTLSSLQGKGYTEIAYVHVDGMTATDAEKTEIENLLKEGVIL